MAEKLEYELSFKNTGALESINEVDERLTQFGSKVMSDFQGATVFDQLFGTANDSKRNVDMLLQNANEVIRSRKAIDKSNNTWETKENTSRYNSQKEKLVLSANDLFDAKTTGNNLIEGIEESVRASFVSGIRAAAPDLTRELYRYAKKMSSSRSADLAGLSDDQIASGFFRSQEFGKIMGNKMASNPNLFTQERMMNYIKTAIPVFVPQYMREKYTRTQAPEPTKFREMLPSEWSSIAARPTEQDRIKFGGSGSSGARSDNKVINMKETTAEGKQVSSLMDLVKKNRYAADAAEQAGIIQKVNGRIYYNPNTTRGMINAMGGFIMETAEVGARGEAKYGITDVDDPVFFRNIKKKTNQKLTGAIDTMRAMHDIFGGTTESGAQNWFRPAHYKQSELPTFKAPNPKDIGGVYVGEVSHSPRMDSRAFAEYSLDMMEQGAKVNGVNPVIRTDKGWKTLTKVTGPNSDVSPDDFHTITLHGSLEHDLLAKHGEKTGHNEFSKNAIYLKIEDELADPMLPDTDKDLKDLIDSGKMPVKIDDEGNKVPKYQYSREGYQRRYANLIEKGYNVDGRHYSFTRFNRTHAEFVPDDIIESIGGYNESAVRTANKGKPAREVNMAIAEAKLDAKRRGMVFFDNGAVEPNEGYSSLKDFAKALDVRNKLATDSENISSYLGSDLSHAKVIVGDFSGLKLNPDTNELELQHWLDGANYISDKITPVSFQGRALDAKATYSKVNVADLFKIYKDYVDEASGDLVLPGAGLYGSDLRISPDVDIIEDIKNIKNVKTSYGYDYDPSKPGVKKPSAKKIAQEQARINAGRSKAYQEGSLYAKTTYDDASTGSRWMSHQLVQAMNAGFNDPQVQDYFTNVFFDEIKRLDDDQQVRELLFNGDQNVNLRSEYAQKRINNYRNMLFERRAKGDVLLPPGKETYHMAAPLITNVFNNAIKKGGGVLSPELESLALNDDEVALFDSVAEWLGLARYPATVGGNIKAKNAGKYISAEDIAKDPKLQNKFQKLQKGLNLDTKGLYFAPGSKIMKLMQTEDFDGDINAVFELMAADMASKDNPEFGQIMNLIYENVTKNYEEMQNLDDRSELQIAQEKENRTKKNPVSDQRYTVKNPNQVAQVLVNSKRDSAKMGLASNITTDAWQYGLSKSVIKAMRDSEAHYDVVSTFAKEAQDFEMSGEEKDILRRGHAFSQLFNWASKAVDTVGNNENSVKKWTEQSQLNFDIGNRVDKANLPSLNIGSTISELGARYIAKRKGKMINGEDDNGEEIFNWDKIFANLSPVDGNTAKGKLTNRLRELKKGFLNADYLMVSDSAVSELEAMRQEARDEISKEINSDPEWAIKSDREKVQEVNRRLEAIGGEVVENLIRFGPTETNVRRRPEIANALQQIQQMYMDKSIIAPATKDWSEYNPANFKSPDSIKEEQKEIEAERNRLIAERDKEIERNRKRIAEQNKPQNNNFAIMEKELDDEAESILKKAGYSDDDMNYPVYLSGLKRGEEPLGMPSKIPQEEYDAYMEKRKRLNAAKTLYEQNPDLLNIGHRATESYSDLQNMLIIGPNGKATPSRELLEGVFEQTRDQYSNWFSARNSNPEHSMASATNIEPYMKGPSGGGSFRIPVAKYTIQNGQFKQVQSPVQQYVNPTLYDENGLFGQNEKYLQDIKGEIIDSQDSVMGTIMHDAFEDYWKSDRKTSVRDLYFKKLGESEDKLASVGLKYDINTHRITGWDGNAETKESKYAKRIGYDKDLWKETDSGTLNAATAFLNGLGEDIANIEGINQNVANAQALNVKVPGWDDVSNIFVKPDIISKKANGKFVVNDYKSSAISAEHGLIQAAIYAKQIEEQAEQDLRAGKHDSEWAQYGHIDEKTKKFISNIESVRAIGVDGEIYEAGLDTMLSMKNDKEEEIGQISLRDAVDKSWKDAIDAKKEKYSKPIDDFTLSKLAAENLEKHYGIKLDAKEFYSTMKNGPSVYDNPYTMAISQRIAELDSRYNVNDQTLANVAGALARDKIYQDNVGEAESYYRQMKSSVYRKNNKLEDASYAKSTLSSAVERASSLMNGLIQFMTTEDYKSLDETQKENIKEMIGNGPAGQGRSLLSYAYMDFAEQGELSTKKYLKGLQENRESIINPMYNKEKDLREMRRQIDTNREFEALTRDKANGLQGEANSSLKTALLTRADNMKKDNDEAELYYEREMARIERYREQNLPRDTDLRNDKIMSSSTGVGGQANKEKERLYGFDDSIREQQDKIEEIKAKRRELYSNEARIQKELKTAPEGKTADDLRAELNENNQNILQTNTQLNEEQKHLSRLTFARTQAQSTDVANITRDIGNIESQNTGDPFAVITESARKATEELHELELSLRAIYRSQGESKSAAKRHARETTAGARQAIEETQNIKMARASEDIYNKYTDMRNELQEHGLIRQEKIDRQVQAKRREYEDMQRKDPVGFYHMFNGQSVDDLIEGYRGIITNRETLNSEIASNNISSMVAEVNGTGLTTVGLRKIARDNYRKKLAEQYAQNPEEFAQQFGIDLNLSRYDRDAFLNNLADTYATNWLTGYGFNLDSLSARAMQTNASLNGLNLSMQDRQQIAINNKAQEIFEQMKNPETFNQIYGFNPTDNAEQNAEYARALATRWGETTWQTENAFTQDSLINRAIQTNASLQGRGLSAQEKQQIAINNKAKEIYEQMKDAESFYAAYGFRPADDAETNGFYAREMAQAWGDTYYADSIDNQRRREQIEGEAIRASIEGRNLNAQERRNVAMQKERERLLSFRDEHREEFERMYGAVSDNPDGRNQQIDNLLLQYQRSYDAHENLSNRNYSDMLEKNMTRYRNLGLTDEQKIRFAINDRQNEYLKMMNENPEQFLATTGQLVAQTEAGKLLQAQMLAGNDRAFLQNNIDLSNRFAEAKMNSLNSYISGTGESRQQKADNYGLEAMRRAAELQTSNRDLFNQMFGRRYGNVSDDPTQQQNQLNSIYNDAVAGYNAMADRNLRAINREGATSLQIEQYNQAAAQEQMDLRYAQARRQRRSRYATGALARNILEVQNRRDSYESERIGLRNQLLDLRTQIDNKDSSIRELRGQEGKEEEIARLQNERNRLAEQQQGVIGRLQTNYQEGSSISGFGAVGSVVSGTLKQTVGRFASMFGRRMFNMAIQEVKRFVKEWDAAMTQIQMITMKSDDQMNELGDNLLKTAKNLKASVSEVTSAAGELYRQGLSDSQVQSRLSEIIKFAKVAGVKSTDATKLATTAINTGLVTSAKQAFDPVAAIGDAAATNAAQIEKGISKAGAAAAIDGTSYGQLVAMLTAITATTGLSGNVAGTTMNSIFGRMNKIGKDEIVYDENGKEMNKSTIANLLRGAGVSMTDEHGGKRSTYAILEDLSKKWDSLSDMQQQQLATAIAGTRQYSNFSAIMQGFIDGDMTEYMDTVEDANGTVDAKYSNYTDTLTASVTSLKTAFDGLVESLTDSGVLTGFLDWLTEAINGFKKLSDAGLGLGAIIPVLTSIAALIIGMQIGGWAGLAVAGAGLVIGATSLISAQGLGSTPEKLSESEQYWQESNALAERNSDINSKIESARELTEKQKTQVLSSKEQTKLDELMVDITTTLGINMKNFESSLDDGAASVDRYSQILDAASTQLSDSEKRRKYEDAEQRGAEIIENVDSDYVDAYTSGDILSPLWIGGDSTNGFEGFFTFDEGTKKYKAPRYSATGSGPKLADWLYGDSEALGDTSQDRVEGFKNFLIKNKGLKLQVKNSSTGQYLTESEISALNLGTLSYMLKNSSNYQFYDVEDKKVISDFGEWMQDYLNLTLDNMEEMSADTNVGTNEYIESIKPRVEEMFNDAYPEFASFLTELFLTELSGSITSVDPGEIESAFSTLWSKFFGTNPLKYKDSLDRIIAENYSWDDEEESPTGYRLVDKNGVDLLDENGSIIHFESREKAINHMNEHELENYEVKPITDIYQSAVNTALANYAEKNKDAIAANNAYKILTENQFNTQEDMQDFMNYNTKEGRQLETFLSTDAAAEIYGRFYNTSDGSFKSDDYTYDEYIAALIDAAAKNSIDYSGLEYKTNTQKARLAFDDFTSVISKQTASDMRNAFNGIDSENAKFIKSVLGDELYQKFATGTMNAEEKVFATNLFNQAKRGGTGLTDSQKQENAVFLFNALRSGDVRRVLPFMDDNSVNGLGTEYASGISGLDKLMQYAAQNGGQLYQGEEVDFEGLDIFSSYKEYQDTLTSVGQTASMLSQFSNSPYVKDAESILSQTTTGKASDVNKMLASASSSMQQYADFNWAQQYLGVNTDKSWDQLDASAKQAILSATGGDESYYKKLWNKDSSKAMSKFEQDAQKNFNDYIGGFNLAVQAAIEGAGNKLDGMSADNYSQKLNDAGLGWINALIDLGMLIFDQSTNTVKTATGGIVIAGDETTSVKTLSETIDSAKTNDKDVKEAFDLIENNWSDREYLADILADPKYAPLFNGLAEENTEAMEAIVKYANNDTSVTEEQASGYLKTLKAQKEKTFSYRWANDIALTDEEKRYKELKESHEANGESGLTDGERRAFANRMITELLTTGTYSAIDPTMINDIQGAYSGLDMLTYMSEWIKNAGYNPKDVYELMQKEDSGVPLTDEEHDTLNGLQEVFEGKDSDLEAFYNVLHNIIVEMLTAPEAFYGLGEAAESAKSDIEGLTRSAKSYYETLKSIRSKESQVSQNKFYIDNIRSGKLGKDEQSFIDSALGEQQGWAKQNWSKLSKAEQNAYLNRFERENNVAAQEVAASRIAQLGNIFANVPNFEDMIKQDQTFYGGIGLTYLPDTEEVQIDTSLLEGSIDQLRAKVGDEIANLVQDILLGQSVTATGVLNIKEGLNGETAFATADVKDVQIKDIKTSSAGHRGGGGGGGKSHAKKLQEEISHEQSIREHYIKMVQYEETMYENRDELTNQITLIGKENEYRKRNSIAIQDEITKLEKELATLEKGSDDWYSTAKAILSAEEALKENSNAIEQNLKKQRELEKQVHQTSVDVEEEYARLKEQARSEQIEQVQGLADMESQIMNTIKTRYEYEWNLQKRDIEKKKEALQKEKDLLDERLNYRKNADDQARKYEELAEYQKQLSLISGDSTRTKDAAELRKKISDLQKELADDTANYEVESKKKAIDDQIAADEQYVEDQDYNLEKLFEDSNNFADKVNSLLSMKREELLQWFADNDLEYSRSLQNTQETMMQNWSDTYDKMTAYVRQWWKDLIGLTEDETKAMLTAAARATNEFMTSSPDAQYLQMWNIDELVRLRTEAHEDSQAAHDWDHEEAEGITGELDTASSKKKKYKVTYSYKDQLHTKEIKHGAGVGSTPQEAYNIAMGYAKKKNVIVQWPDISKAIAFANGGLVDFTGPAWVDGTPTRPEAFLSADDTVMIRDLLDAFKYIAQPTISSINQSAISGGNSNTIGDVYVTLNEAKFDNDDDYEQIAIKVGETFVRELSRQGFNTANYGF